MNWTPDYLDEYDSAQRQHAQRLRELNRLIAAEPPKGGRPPGRYTPPKPRDKARDRQLRKARKEAASPAAEESFGE